MADITAIVLTRNEEQNLPDCLRSLEGFARRVVVVDSGSTDATCAIAREAGADVLVHPFETHARQFNWALDNAGVDTAWCLRLDADERLTPALCAELEALMTEHATGDVNGIVLQAWLYFMGRRLSHVKNMKRKLMVFKTGLGRVEDRHMDEHTRLLSGRSVDAKERFLHYDYKDMTHYIGKLNWYAGREVRDYFDYLEGRGQNDGLDAVNSAVRSRKFKVYYRLPMFLRCWLMFVYSYVFRLGFLDGREGFLYHYMYHRWYRTLVDAKIYEHLKTGKPFESLGPLKE
ncbi:MAG: glycosyltransferase family 2 protein [Clostridia bacterium]|nr:glycosyltransferase family 2 protein [Clostridia bacterium]